jgi:hypothetical protein
MRSRRDEDVDSIAYLLWHLLELIEAERNGSCDDGMQASVKDRGCLSLRLVRHAWHREVGPREQYPPWAVVPQAVGDGVTAEPCLKGLGAGDD